MRIVDVNIPQTDGDGLGQISMKRLEDIVIIAGRNGAGKTRLFDKIKTYMGKKPRLSIMKKFERDYDSSVDKLNQFMGQTSRDYARYEQKRDAEKIVFYGNRLNELKEIQQAILWNFINTTEFAEEYQVVHFVPKEINLTDPADIPRKEVNIPVIWMNLVL